MKITLSILFLLMIIVVPEDLDAQNTATYESLTLPRSIRSTAMGGQGVAMKNSWDALQYNPANLIYSEDVSISFFRHPWKLFGSEFPLASGAASLKLPNGMAAGIEFTDQEYPETIRTTEQNPDAGTPFHYYQRSIAGAFALPLGSEWALGAHLRYAWMPVSPGDLANDILFSTGASYTPAAWSERATFGCSLMNFGAPMEFPSVEGTASSPMPALINLGAAGAILSERHFDVSCALGFTKPLAKLNDGFPFTAQSSFKALFTSWKNFPQDVTTHLGLGYQWKPLPLGEGISFFQEMYLGYYSVGSSADYISFFTHGVSAGFDIRGVKVTAGYAGWWHNNNAERYARWTIPWENFQITVSTDMDRARWREITWLLGDRLSGIVLSGGYAFTRHVGRMKDAPVGTPWGTLTQPAVWSVESDFYITDNTALIASLAYGRVTESLDWWGEGRGNDRGIETLGLESGYRYHPFDVLHPLFIQASLGIMWINPVADFTEPLFSYKTFDDLVVGCVVPVGGTGIVVIPRAGFKTLFMEIDYRGSKLGGYSQFEFGMNVGYRL